MSDRVFIDLPGAERCIGDIKSAIQMLEEAARKVDTTMGSLVPGSWDGNAANKAVSTYNQDYRTLLTKTVPEAVNSFNEFIQTCKNTLQEVDTQLSGK